LNHLQKSGFFNHSAEKDFLNGWELRSIESLCLKVTSGGTPYRKNPAFYTNGTIRWIKTKELKDAFIYDSEEKITEDAIKESSAKIFPANTVLMAMYGDGRTITSLGILGKEAATNQACCAFITNPEVCDFRFLFYSLMYHRKKLLNLALGGAQRNLSTKIIKNFAINVPILSTQRKIAAILSAYDDLIENNTRRIKILEEMAQALYREWFVHFRFPGHEKVRMVDSPLGKIPEGWEVKKLGKIADINATSLKNGNSPEEIHYVDISSVSTGQVDRIELISFSKAPSRARRIVRHGDMIWSAVRPNRRSYSLILNPPPDLIVSTGFAVISSKYTPYTYLYQALTTDDFVSYLTNHATGAAYPAVTTHDFEDANILHPPKELLDLFHVIAKDFIAQKHNLLQKNLNLRFTRDLLLPKLINGRLKVNEIFISEEEI